MDKDKCWNGGKTNTSLELKQEVKVDKVEQEKLWERIKNQIPSSDDLLTNVFALDASDNIAFDCNKASPYFL